MDLKRVLVADAVDSACVNLLVENGIQVECKLKLTKEQLLAEIPSYDGLVVRSDTKVTAEVLLAGARGQGRLKVVGRAGAGVDNIDMPAATQNGVAVLNTPGGNAISACELTCALLLDMARHVAAAADSMKQGRWDRKLYAGSEVYGKTLAVLGLGRIGREVAVRMQAFGMKTIGYDPIVTAAQAAQFGVDSMPLEQIWPLADYITVHTPLIPQTKNLVNASTLAKCRRGVRIINVARGGIIDESALLAALESGQCAAAAVDVYAEEPPVSEVTKRLVAMKQVVATPHLGASTAEAQVRVAVEVAEQFGQLKRGDFSAANGVLNREVLQKYTK